MLRRLPRTLAASDTIRLVLVYMAGTAVIAGLALASQFISQRSAARLSSDQHLLAVARNQQVLSQRIAGLTTQVQSASPGSDRLRAASELDALVRQWDRAHNGLRQGDAALGLPANDSDAVEMILMDMHPKYVGVSQAAGELIGGARLHEPTEATTIGYIDKAADRLIRHERSLQDGMDRFVYQIEYESQARARSTILWQRLLVAALFVAVGVQGALVLVPVTRRFSRAARRIAQLEADLAAMRQLRDRPAPAAAPRQRPSSTREIVLPRRVEPVAAVA